MRFVTLKSWPHSVHIIAAFLSQAVIELLKLSVPQNSANKVQAHSEAIAKAAFRNAEAAEKMRGGNCSSA
jgi:hypothetical protein